MGTQPVVDAGLCALDRLAVAHCSACVDACPTLALSAGPDGGLELAAAKCTACGGCAAACPAGAIAMAGAVPLPRASVDRKGRVSLVCPERGGGTCLQALGLEALARLWRDGVRQVALDTGDCTACPNGATLRFGTWLATLNAILADRGLAGLSAAPAGSDRRPPRLDAADRPDARRRAFLAPLLASSEALPALHEVQQAGAGRPGRRFAYAPAIDPAACSGCGACANICPTAAMTLINAGRADAAYETRPEACNGCRLCMDVCDEGAVTLGFLAPAAPPVSLRAYRCAGCGVPGHYPRADGPEGGFCPVCRKAAHYRKLHVIQA